MLVDDSTSVRLMMRLILEEAGYDIIEAESGARALIQLAEEKVDLIFLDFIMPLMSGIDFLKILKSVPDTCAIPVVMVTTETTRQWKNQGRRFGCRNWLIKPFKKKKLTTLTHDILGS